MSYVARPRTVSGSAVGQAGLECYDPGGVLNYNAPYTLMAWHKYGQEIPRGFIFHIGKRDVGGWDAFDAIGPHNDNYKMKTSIGPRDGTDYFLNYNEAGQSLHPVTGMLAPHNPEFAPTGDALWTVPWNLMPPWWYNGFTQWGHFALVRESVTAVKTYINGVLIQSITHASFPLTRGPATSILLGGRYIGPAMRQQGTYQDYGHDGKWAYARAFASALTQAQIQVEMGYQVAGGPGGGGLAWADWPLVSDYNDISGNDRHLAIGYGMPATGYDPNAAEYFKWDADLPSGVLPLATTVAIPSVPSIGVLLSSGIAVRGDPPLAIAGTPLVTPRIMGRAEAEPRLDGAGYARPRIIGVPRAYPS